MKFQIEVKVVDGHDELAGDNFLEVGDAVIAELTSELISNDDQEAILARIASAAAEEYLSVISGEKNFRRISDVNEYRLFLLMKWMFQGQIPSERLVSQIFNFKVSESRSLLRGSAAKYRRQMKDLFREQCCRLISEVKFQGEKNRVLIDNVAIVEELNNLLAKTDRALQPLKKSPNTIGEYCIEQSSLSALKKALGFAE